MSRYQRLWHGLANGDPVAWIVLAVVALVIVGGGLWRWSQKKNADAAKQDQGERE